LQLARAFLGLLQSAEYMDIKNVLYILTMFSSSFPLAKKQGAAIEQRVTIIHQRETKVCVCVRERERERERERGGERGGERGRERVSERVWTEQR